MGWGVRVIQVNKKYPKAKQIFIPKMQKYEDKNRIQYKITKSEIMNYNECKKKYGELVDVADDEETKIFFITMEIKNSSNRRQTLEISNFYLENKNNCNGIPMDSFYDLNKEVKLNCELAAGQKVTVLIPYDYPKSTFLEKAWDKMNWEDYKVVIKHYPEKVSMGI